MNTVQNFEGTCHERQLHRTDFRRSQQRGGSDLRDSPYNEARETANDLASDNPFGVWFGDPFDRHDVDLSRAGSDLVETVV